MTRLIEPVPILFYFNYYGAFTGGPRTLISILEQIDKNKFSPVVATQDENALAHRARQIPGVEVVVLRQPGALQERNEATLAGGPLRIVRNGWETLRYNRSVAREVQRRGIRLVWARGLKGVLVTGFAAARNRIPLIWDVALEKPSRGLVRLLHWIGLRLATRVIFEAPSQYEATFGTKWTRRHGSKFTHIESAIPESTREEIQLATATKGSRRLSEETVSILCVGTIGPRKSQRQLYEAVKEMLPERPDLRLDIVGSADDPAYLDELAAEISRDGLVERVALHGWSEKIPEWLAQSDILALPSRNEGVPHVIKEAMHSGLPVVATRVGGVPDTVEDGQTGILVDPDDRVGLIEALRRLVENAELRQRMGANARERAEQRFSPRAESAAYEALFREILTSTSQRRLFGHSSR